MTKRKPPTERAEDKGEGGAKTGKLATIERFKHLARKVVAVPKEELEKEQKRYESERRKIPNRKG